MHGDGMVMPPHPPPRVKRKEDDGGYTGAGIVMSSHSRRARCTRKATVDARGRHRQPSVLPAAPRSPYSKNFSTATVPMKLIRA